MLGPVHDGLPSCPVPPPLPPLLPVVRRRPPPSRGSTIRAAVAVGSAGLITFALVVGALSLIRPPIMNWPEPLPILVFPKARAADYRSLPPDSALPTLWTLFGATRALGSVSPSDQSLFRIHGVLDEAADRWVAAVRAAQPARTAWTRAARAPWVYCDDEPSHQLATWLSEAVAMAVLESARIQIEWRSGLTNSALSGLEDLLRNGRGLSGGGPLIQVITGWSVTEEALRCARRLARHTAQDVDIERLLRLLGPTESFTQTACEGFRHETVALLNVAQQLFSVLWVGYPPVPGAPRLPGWARDVNRRVLVRIGSEPSTTQRRLVAAMSLLIAAVEEPTMAAPRYEELRRQVRTLTAFFDDPTATLVLQAFLPDLTAVRRRITELEEGAAATRWVLAVQYFVLKNGRLPHSLEEAHFVFEQADVPAPSASNLRLHVWETHWSIVTERGRVYGLVDVGGE